MTFIDLDGRDRDGLVRYAVGRSPWGSPRTGKRDLVAGNKGLTKAPGPFFTGLYKYA